MIAIDRIVEEEASRRFACLPSFKKGAEGDLLVSHARHLPRERRRNTPEPRTEARYRDHPRRVRIPGQECSAASRVYVPDNLWPQVRDSLVAQVDGIRMGDVSDFSSFMGAVIDAASFATQKAAIDEAKSSSDATILVGGEYDDAEGWFVRPTVIVTTNPDYRTMREELFGPVLTLHVYEEAKWLDTLDIVDRTSPYALTGAIFAQDRCAIQQGLERLRNAAGNFYVNDKPTGAVVGQQPFGGACVRNQ